MKDIVIDGRLQVTAGVALLLQSRLVEWNWSEARFEAVLRDAFEHNWRKYVDQNFGRLMCWMMFSAGAEFLLKGLCLLHGIDMRESKTVAAYPHGDIDAWAHDFNRGITGGTMPVTKFGVLNDLLKRRTNSLSRLDRLIVECDASNEDAERIQAAYELLRSSIRNRDAHAYVPNVRGAHHHLVPELFACCFNAMVQWLPGGASTLGTWMAESSTFIPQA